MPDKKKDTKNAPVNESGDAKPKKKNELVDDPFPGSVKDEKTGKYHLPK